MQLLILVLCAAVAFALLAVGFDWVCGKFFPNFTPARWICGVILIVLLIVFANWLFSGTGAGYSFPWHHQG